MDVVLMVSGGARARSGPAPDPNALRRDRKDDKEWLTLPLRFDGVAPEFPLSGASTAERDLWESLWRKPQASMWAALDLSLQVAAYVRAFLRSVESDAPVGLISPVLRMEAELGISTVGMNALRWKFAPDELAERRAEKSETPTVATGVRDRLGAVGGGG